MKSLLLILLASTANALSIRGVGDATITTDKLATDAVTAAKILSGAVTTTKIATDAVVAAKILDGAVTTTKLATDAVTAAKIIAGAVTTAKLGSDLALTGSASIDTPTFVVDADNNRVGIGTANPATKIHMSSGNFTIDGDGNPQILATAGAVGTPSYSFSGTTDGVYRPYNNTVGIAVAGVASGIFNPANGATTPGLAIGGANSSGLSSITANTLSVLANSAEVARYTSTGLGIGDTTPDAQLEILSNSAETGYALSISSQSDVTGGILSVLGNGNVGIGIAAPATKMHMSSGTLTIDGTSPKLVVGAARQEMNTNEVDFYATTDNSGSFAFLTSVGGSNGTALSISNARKVEVAAGAFRIYQRTKAQLDAITPAVGDMYTCSNCTLTYAVCVGTAATLSGFRRMDSATVGCGTGE